MPEVPLDGADIRAHLHEVAAELGSAGPRQTVVLVGGALLALAGLRKSTVDVDTVRMLDAELRRAVATVAGAHDLAPNWLNDHAAAFVPATFNERDCETLLVDGRLEVLGAPFSQVFVMKLHAARPHDVEDMARMWPRTGFSSADQAAHAYALAYPHEVADPHLARFVAEVVPNAQ